MSEFLTRLRFFFRRRLSAELDEELQFHLEQATRANIAAGMTREEARRQARIEFGGLESAREQTYAQRPGWWMETMLQDIRYALRGFRRNPIFTITVISTLALGIGATTAVFSVVDPILFRSLPYANADRLVSVGLVAPIEPQEFMLGGSYYEWRDHQRPFVDLTSETGAESCDLTEEKPARLSCAGVEANFLPTLGVSPILGRDFTADEDTPAGPKVALLSYALWRSRFGLDRSVVGRLIHIDGRAVRIVGVLPKDFEMPRLQAVDLLRPEELDVAAQRRADPGRPMWAFARLKLGVSVEQAKAQLQPLFDYSLRLAPAPFRKEVHLRVRTLRDRQMQAFRVSAWILFGLVIAVLLIACANVTGMLMARDASRERELAIRSAMGATRIRLVRQALTESFLLSMAGAFAGSMVATLLLRFFIEMAPDGLLFLSKARIDLRVLSFTLVISLLGAVVFGLIPALHKPHTQTLGGSLRFTASHAVFRQGLVVSQIAVSVVLLAGGTLLYRSFRSLQDQNLGMRPESVLTASITLDKNTYPTAESEMAFFQQLERNLRYGPSITALAVSDSLPPGGYHRDTIYASIAVDGEQRPIAGTGGTVAWRWVTPEYFRALEIPLLKGKGFTEGELTSTDHFVVLSKSLAARLFPHRDPIDQRLRLNTATPAPDNPAYTVVGVVPDVKNNGLMASDEPEYYRLRRNVPQDWNNSGVVILKTTLPAGAEERWIRSEAATIDPTVPVDTETLTESVGKMADQPRFETLLVGFFAATGLLIAVLGLYGVVSFVAIQRTREIGVRMALGASRFTILRLILWQAGD